MTIDSKYEQPDGGTITVIFQAVPGSAARAKSVARRMCSETFGGGFPAKRHISQSATAGLAAVAMSSVEDRAIGVDVEQIMPAWVDRGLLEIALHPDEWK